MMLLVAMARSNAAAGQQYRGTFINHLSGFPQPLPWPSHLLPQDSVVRFS